ncbi:MAG: flagellar FliJ family protein [Nitrospiraceae bacterium]
MKLDVLRRLRQQAEDHLQIALADVDRRLEQTRTLYTRLRTESDARAVEYLVGGGRARTTDEVQQSYQKWEGAMGDLERTASAVARIQEERDRAQAALALAIQERKQIEMMEQRRLRERQTKQRRREQVQMDDIANSRWAMAAQERRREDEAHLDAQIREGRL